MKIWGLEVNGTLLTEFEVSYLKGLPETIQSMSWVCSELDRVWNEFGLDNSHDISAQPIGKYYSHPVWLMNGIFSARDNESMLHRQAIAKFIQSIPNKSVADYGGGFGELALAISRTCPNTQVSIVEPYPTKIGKNRVENDDKITFRFDLDDENYDVIVAQDVLEHVSDPLKLAYEFKGDAAF
jgi:2-polyprenyl-6-hydroxyphenyl methylase/3-demethylubiquinone-9 3-methyltransferase